MHPGLPYEADIWKVQDSLQVKGETVSTNYPQTKWYSAGGNYYREELITGGCMAVVRMRESWRMY